jgi:hypothetical protein
MDQFGVLNVIFLIIYSVTSIQVNAQCNPETYSLNGIEKLKEGYIYLKSYNIDGNNGAIDRIEYTAVFSKDTDYLLNICTESNDVDGIILSIYDSNRKQVASNIVNNAIHSSINFDCRITGIYYLTFTFQNSRKQCGGCILAFRKQ